MRQLMTINELTYQRNYRSILKQVNLTVQSGKIIGLLGANGAGKTTLMRLIVGGAKGHGTIKIDGDSTELGHKRAVSYTGNLAGFNSNWRITQVVDFYQMAYPDFSTERFTELQAFMELDLQLRLSALSKGMHEKLAIALALSRQTSLYLLDEPFSGIDSMSRKRIISSILQWKPADATIILSDHYISEIAMILDEIVVIKDQQVLVHKAADDIRAESGMDLEAYYESLYAEEG